MVEDHSQWDTGKNFPKQKIIQAAEELETYKKIARDLKENLERTNHYYQKQIISYEKRAHFNWLVAQAAEK
jgi:chromatin segregation and condensation protein Rec8/ScpA/Scc1 (kleisin family)